MDREITEALIGRQAPEAQAIIRLLLARIQMLEERLNQSVVRRGLIAHATQHEIEILRVFHAARAWPPRIQRPSGRNGEG
jgi:hypothetical protein